MCDDFGVVLLTKKEATAVRAYVTTLAEKLKTGKAGEHAYRVPFEELIKSVAPFLTGIINDPKRSVHGAPDFVFLKGDLTVGYAETKDIGDDLNKVEKSEQMERYYGYSNIILTNYIEFRFFRNGEKWSESISIARLSGKTLSFRPELFSELENTIHDFLSSRPEAIQSGKLLAQIMGGKARRIRDNVHQYFTDNEWRHNTMNDTNQYRAKRGKLVLVPQYLGMLLPYPTHRKIS